MKKIYVYDYDLLILDINLPDGTGLDLIRLAKQEKSTTPIIVISARNSLNQKIEGLELGADDYLTKPFELAELTARVKSVLRRWSFDGSNQITAGNITVDPDDKTVTVDGADLNLTRTEYSLLLYFMANPNRVLSRDSIAEHIWGDHMDMADTFDFLYTHMKKPSQKNQRRRRYRSDQSRLRRRIQAGQIVSPVLPSAARPTRKSRTDNRLVARL